MEGRSSITELLALWSAGDPNALDELAPQVQRELHEIARSYLSRARGEQILQPTALINEAYLRLLGHTKPLHWENGAHFLGIAARLMRHVLVDYSRARKAEKRGGAAEFVTLADTRVLGASRAPDVLEIDEAMNELAKIDERKAKVVELRYFGGLSREEVAAALNLTVPTVKRDLRLAEAWLRRFLSRRDIR